ncbi:conserved hypothetical protein [Culex quinquefasciatus]|uniref:CYRIA/CYRIB Rac1 binding domain-containing protein n=1 Tax=Culex quinquefasciatus TaxID=7176 RepID=B0WXF3_CULQU|nr:conserved hypothetical protein [Culex quinquefasciatus]|eukprot:XP_001862075.1 conserved hypothetical protein [Culex quinquefasciatus]
MLNAAAPLLKTPMSQAQAQAYNAATYTAAAARAAYGAAAAAAQPTVAGYATIAGYGREYADPYLGHGIGPVPGYGQRVKVPSLVMGKLLSLLARDESTCCTPKTYDVFLDFENAAPTDLEREVYEEVERVQRESEIVLDEIQCYKVGPSKNIPSFILPRTPKPVLG